MTLIERNEYRGFGQPVLAGRRLTVYNALFYASIRDSIEFFLDEFGVSLDELKAAVSYCKNRECNLMQRSTDRYCDGCVLRSISDGWRPITDQFMEENSISYSTDGSVIYLGTLAELEDDEFGRLGWILAEEVEARILKNE